MRHSVLCAVLQADPELIGALNRLRLGQMDRATEMLLSELKRPLPDDGISATRLFPHNHDVSKAQQPCPVNRASTHTLPQACPHFSSVAWNVVSQCRLAVCCCAHCTGWGHRSGCG